MPTQREVPGTEFGAIFPSALPIPGTQPTAPGVGGIPGHRTFSERINVPLGAARTISIPFAARRVAIWNPSGYDVYLAYGSSFVSSGSFDLVAPGNVWTSDDAAVDSLSSVSVVTVGPSTIQPASTRPYFVVSATEDGSPPLRMTTTPLTGNPSARVFTETNLQPDVASGFYNIYGLTNITFQNTCREVRVTSNVSWGTAISVVPQTLSSGSFVNIGQAQVLAPGQSISITGPVNKLSIGAMFNDVPANVYVEEATTLTVVGLFDPTNPGSSSNPSVPTSFSGWRLGSMADPAFSVKLFSSASLAASASSVFSLGVEATTKMLIGHHTTLHLGLDVSEGYSLSCYPASSPDMEGIGSTAVTLASSVSATPALSLPSTSIDGTPNLSASAPLDWYDIASKVGIFPGYMFVITNSAATSATVTAWLTGSSPIRG